MTYGLPRGSRKPILSDSALVIRWYLIFGITFLLYAAAGELPLRTPFATLGMEKPAVFALAILGLFLLNGWFFAGVLTARAKIERPVPRWLRCFRFCFAGIPLLGIYVLPVWDWIASNERDWKGRGKKSTSPPSLFFHQASHALPFLSILVWGLNLLILYNGLSWLHAADQVPPAIQWGLQGLGFLCVQLDLLDLHRRRSLPAVSNLLLYLFSIFWFLPSPVSVSAGLVHCFLLVAHPEPKLRMQEFFAGRFGLHHRLDKAFGRDWWRVSGWRAWRSPAWLSNPKQDFADDSWRIVRLYRSRVALTGLDAMALTLALALMVKMWPTTGRVPLLLCAVTLPVSLFLLLIGLLVLVADFVLQHFGTVLISHSSHHTSLKYLVLTQLALLSGFWIGHLLAIGDIGRLGHSLLWGGWITSLLAWFFALPVHPRHPGRWETGKLMPWIIMSMCAACSGQLLLSGNAQLADLLKTTLRWTGLTSPFLGLTLGFFLGRRSWGPSSGLERPCLAVCSSMLPFGGLALPFWALRQDSLQPQPVLTLPELDESGGLEALARIHPSAKESQNYFFSHIVHHLATAGNLPGMFRLAEETSFLGDQIAHSKGVHKTLEDIESWIVPAAIHTNCWEKFIRFLTMAIHLRGIAAELAEPTVLRALVEQEQFEVAEDALNGIVDPLQRAVGKAIVAGALDPSSDGHQRLVQSLVHDLVGLALPQDAWEQERQFDALIVISQELGPIIQDTLTLLLAERGEWSDAIWLSAAQCHADRAGALQSGFWDLLRRIKDSELLRRYLPDELAVRGLSDPEGLIHQVDLQIAGNDPQLAWLCRAALLGAIAQSSLDEAWDLWQRWNALRSAPWSIEFVERAALFLRGQNEGRIVDLAKFVQDDEAGAALWVTALSTNRGPRILESAMTAIDRLLPGSVQLHWKLRFVSASASLDPVRVPRYLKELSQSVDELGYAIGHSDLCEFLCLIARFLPEDLHDEMERVLWAPAVGPAFLFTLAEQAEAAELLAHLFENLDRYFVPFFPAEADGFRAWSEILVKITSRLCALRQDLEFLNHALRLNPEDSDLLRVAVVDSLAAVKQNTLAEAVCGLITSRRLRFLTLLKLRHGLTQSSPKVSLHAILATLSAAEPICQELLGLKAVAAVQGLSLHAAYSVVRRLKSPQEQFSILVRLAKRSSRASRRAKERRRWLDILSQAVGLVTSDAQLAAWVPELFDFVATSERRLVPETREALRSLLSLGTVSWAMRREACESLLARALPRLAEHAEKSAPGVKSAIAELIAEVLADVLGDAGDEEKRSLVPVLFAVLDRLPVGVMERFLRRSTPSELIWLYLRGKDELIVAWDRELEKDEPDALVLETVLYLLSYCAPALVPVGLGLLPPSSFRDRAGSNLLRHGWLAEEFAPDVLRLIEKPAFRLSTEVWIGLASHPGSEEEGAWLNSLGSLVAQELVDSTDPRNELWLHKLWTIHPDRSRPVLAQAALRALSNQGHVQGEAALCLWLHAHLAPDAGRDPVELLALCAEAEQAVQRAVTLPSIPISTNA